MFYSVAGFPTSDQKYAGRILAVIIMIIEYPILSSNISTKNIIATLFIHVSVASCALDNNCPRYSLSFLLLLSLLGFALFLLFVFPVQGNEMRTGRGDIISRPS